MERMKERLINVRYEEGGISAELGVRSNCNMFEPNTDIPYFAVISSVDGNKKVIVEFSDTENVVDSADYEISANKNCVISGEFKGKKNGVYTLSFHIEGLDVPLSFNVGVVPKSKRAKDSFYFGVQPYLCNTYASPNYRVKYQGKEESWDSIIATINFLGSNLIREDGVSWTASQPSQEADYDHSLMGRFVDMTEENDIVLLWILGSPAKWAIMDKYKNSEHPGWSLPPEAGLWDNRMRSIAKNYKGRKKLFYEIWNEADWEFFNGTEEEYIDLLNRSCRIIREEDPEAFIIPSALVSSWETDQKPGFAKNSIKYYSAYKPLLENGSINALNIHDHAWFIPEKFLASVDRKNGYLKRAGFENGMPKGVFNTEAGIWTEDEQMQARMLMNKILWYRANDFKAYVAYDFRDYHDTGSKWPIFTSTLEPKPAAIAYTVLIGMLGQKEYSASIPTNSNYVFADIYSDSEGSVVPFFAFPDVKAELKIISDKKYKAYDIYGNPITDIENGRVKAGESAIYLVFEDQVDLCEFEVDLQ